eukprot:4233914-Pleurochrysis_carterae.AAC.1
MSNAATHESSKGTKASLWYKCALQFAGKHSSFATPIHGSFLPKSVSVRSPVCEATLGASFLFSDIHRYTVEAIDV